VEFPFIAGLQKSLLKNVGLCGGFRFLVSGCTKVDFIVGGGFRGFRGFRFLGRPLTDDALVSVLDNGRSLVYPDNDQLFIDSG